jgi:hypothetical protein
MQRKCELKTYSIRTKNPKRCKYLAVGQAENIVEGNRPCTLRLCKRHLKKIVREYPDCWRKLDK